MWLRNLFVLGHAFSQVEAYRLEVRLGVDADLPKNEPQEEVGEDLEGFGLIQDSSSILLEPIELEKKAAFLIKINYLFSHLLVFDQKSGCRERRTVLRSERG